MERIFEQALLYDFYGELLTPHQRIVYEDAVCNDMSLGEIAKEQGISRQGVHDLLRRCDRALQDYESKLHLVERFMRAKNKVREIEELTGLSEDADGEKLRRNMREIRRLSEELKEDL
ncbi:MAG: DNA-binding protein [Roseburia sp.]|nr:DNA-binding protein [Roseburia sp.]